MIIEIAIANLISILAAIPAQAYHVLAWNNWEA
jgi:hypothetical protein